MSTRASTATASTTSSTAAPATTRSTAPAASTRPAIPGRRRSPRAAAAGHVTDAGGTDTLANVEIVDDSASGKTLLVGNGGYASIQAAIDAASDGDTIVVASGTWTGDLNVNKDVTIQGVNNHGIAGTAARGAETVIDGQIVVTAAGATVDGVKLVGAAPGPLGSTAVQVEANDFSLVNSVVNGSGVNALITYTVTGVDIGHNLLPGL